MSADLIFKTALDLPTIPITPKRILVVDGDEPVRRNIVKTLEIEGYVVQQAPNASLAVRAIQQLQPDLIIVAIDLPVQSNRSDNPIQRNAVQSNQPGKRAGLDFCQNVRSNPSWTAIPFIFLISKVDNKETQRIKELGVEDFITKPVNHESLVRIVHARLLRSAELQIALIDQAYLETIEVLANTVEGRDPYTHGHIDRVSMYAQWLAEAMDWPAEQLRNLAFGARLHDIGKIIIPDHILKKPGELTHEEWELMKQHPTAGGRILRDIKHLKNSLNYVLYHHERWDGSGYPYGLAGREIPIEGRLLAIADVFDALTTDRPYHPAQTRSEVLAYMRQRAGVEFDPDLVPIFIRALDAHMRID